MLNGSFAAVLNLKLPSESVVVPADSPITLILAPGMGCLLLSVTEPVIVFCALIVQQKKQ